MEDYQIFPVVPWGTVGSVRGWESNKSCQNGNKKKTQEWTQQVKEYLLSTILFTPLPLNDEIILLWSCILANLKPAGVVTLLDTIVSKKTL